MAAMEAAGTAAEMAVVKRPFPRFVQRLATAN
jgi:hypothetical protein